MYTFKDLKVGNTLFIINRDSLETNKGCITGVTPPHPDPKTGNMLQQVVEITANINEKTMTYVAQDNATTTYSGSLIISGDKDSVLNEVKAIRSQCEHILQNVDDTKRKYERCNEVISDLDDVFRERQENEARLTKLESMMQSILDKLL